MFTHPDISIIVPIYNEESNIRVLYQQIDDVFRLIPQSFEIVFVDDGSKDKSLSILTQLHKEHKGKVKVVSLSRNFGHQLALSAGFSQCKGKAAIVMDADLQDPPSLIKEFIAKWVEGYKIVYGVRQERQGETFFKKFTAALFYKLIRLMTSIDIPENAGDFYLLDRKVVDFLNSLRERHRFIRGLIAWVGYKRIGVPYVRQKRLSGTTKYSLWKLIKFSWDAVTSFSFAPLRFVSWLGGFFAIISFCSILIIIYMKLFTDRTIIGWSSLMAVVLFVGGIQLLAIGIIGEYIARIGDDVKARPLYAVSQILE